MTFSVQRCHIFCVFTNIDVLQPSQDQNVISCQKASKSVSKWPRYLTKTAKIDVFRAAFPHFLRFIKYCCFITFPGPKSSFLPKGVPVGFEMAEKNAYRQTDRQTDRQNDRHFRIQQQYTGWPNKNDFCLDGYYIYTIDAIHKRFFALTW